jgi:hypothetical protein
LATAIIARARRWYRRMTMALNRKLTRAIKDSVVQNLRLNASILLINFDDGSKLTVTIAECNSPTTSRRGQNPADSGGSDDENQTSKPGFESEPLMQPVIGMSCTCAR